MLAAVLPGRGWPKMWDCGPPVYFVDYENPSPGAQTARSFLFSTTNVSPDFFTSYTSATTSGTSGCKGFFGTFLLRLERQKFLANAHEKLLEESVRGQGPHLSGLATLMGCPQSHFPQFKKALRTNHFVLFEESLIEPTTPDRLLFEITRIIEQHPEMSGICKLHG